MLSSTARSVRCEPTKGEPMKPDALHPEGHDAAHHPHKPKHLAERLESYVGVGSVVIGAILLALLIYAFMQTGSQTPPWMK